IVDNYKDSKFYDESLYRIGVLNYYLATDADNPPLYYANAVKCFDELVEKPGSKYKYDAVYQRGWVRLNSMEEEDLKLAMSDFLTLLNAIENNQITDPVLIQDYRDDAVDNIAYCLIALDGTDISSQSKGVAELQSVFGNFSNKEIISRVVDKAAEKKFNLDSSMQAVDYIWLKINMAPLAIQNPSLVDSILYIYARDPRNLRDGQDVLQANQDLYLKIIADYGKDSEWYRTNKDSDLASQLSVIKKAYEKRGERLKNDFIANRNDAALDSLKQHMANFAAFPEIHGDTFASWSFSTEKDILVLGTMLAESSKLPIHYVRAIENLHSFNAKYPEDEDFFLYEGLSSTYSQELWTQLNEKYAQPDYVAEAGLPADLDALYALYSSNMMRFVGVLLSEKYSAEQNKKDANIILLNLADLQYTREKFADSASLYLKALEQEPIMDNRTKFDVYGRLAIMSRADKKHADAEKYYRNALTFAQTPDQRTAITSEINVEIQSSFELAQESGDFNLEATERLRLATELGNTNPAKIQGLKWGAHEAYVKAKEYQKAIDILLELAGTSNDVEVVYTYYFNAWEIAEADTAMNNKALAADLKGQFIAKHPGSNQAYKLRIFAIQRMEENPAAKTAAAEAYIVMHDEARNKAIDTGEDTPDLFLEIAAKNYGEAGNKPKQLEVYNRFITLYPNHKNVIPYMQVIADDHLANGDTLSFEQVAKDIFKKDSTKNDRFQFIAQVKLDKLMRDFDTAYKNLEYTEAFRLRDEYKRVEATYVREGLTFENAGFSSSRNGEYFARVKQEYDNIQQFNAFLRNFDTQIAAIEKGNFLKASPASLINVNANTKWQKNLIGGTNRIPAFKNSVNAEVKKVTTILERADATEFVLDNSRRLRALDVMAQIYKKGYNTIQTQVRKYFEIATELVQVRKDQPELVTQLAHEQSSDMLDQEYLTLMKVYNLYHLAGYTDAYTKKTVDRLEELKWTPDYKIEEYQLSSGWTQKMDDADVNLSIQSITSPNGVKLGSTDIPANKQLKLLRAINTRIAPDIALLQLVYPYDIEIRLNGTEIKSGDVATDSLVANKPITTRYAFLLPKGAWTDGQNNIEITIPNTSSQNQNLCLSLQVFTDRRSLAEAIPAETVNLMSDTKWRVIQVNAENGEETSSNAVLATSFGITMEQIDGLKDTAAKPIWFTETDTIATAVFEVDFDIDTEFRQGSIEFVAPENVSIMLNGEELSSNISLDYEASPFQVFSSQVEIDKAKVKTGKNTLRFNVSNSSAYRGFLAAITIVKAGKEEVR
ncbi:MAG: hypothetical protein PHO32_07295, partial [Candidatus Cloacimonetes bacterium]|nr:hypothetical protein [Candidatus Cloacimonadota bacterium]